MKFVDGLICDFPNVPVMQFSADCPLILAIEPDRRVFGTAHASWRGTVTQIAAELVRMMRVEFGVDPARLRVAICPCAGAEEYEVGEDVYRIAQARLGDVKRFFTVTQGRRFFDMRLANASQLIASGVAAENILSAGASTMSDERFYSHRRDGAETGRFALIAGFRE
jgi:YfiH family protein